ncbi:MAG: hypothetical protein JW748_08005 [Anaerolineales bacterium]|nr:hypothetical protein [Anaerolineales bacterium]
MAAAGAALAAMALSACTIELVTPTFEPTRTPTFTPELPLSSLLPTLEAIPTELPTAAPSRTPDALRPGEAEERIFHDPLDNAITGWNLAKSEAGTVDFSGGMLVFTANAAYLPLVSILPRDFPADIYIDVTVQTLLCAESYDTFGIIFRNGKDYSYRLAVTCFGQMRFERIKGLQVEGASVWRETLGLLRGAPATNRIGVLIRGQVFRFFVGGIEVFSGHDPMSTTGGIGLFVRTEKGTILSVGFEEISVYTLLETSN